MECSILICTRNRAASLRRTLQALHAQDVPPEWEIEIIMVDNASTDDTAAVVREFGGRFAIVSLYEERANKSHALNTGLRHARGETILFTDDDVVPDPGWVRAMAGPLLRRECDAVSGRVHLWSEILRPWMGPMHRVWLAAHECAEGETFDLIGANMGIHRSVLGRVASFDPALGPSGLGNAEDTLFAKRLLSAGFQIRHVSAATVLHCPDPARLTAARWRGEAENRGRSAAYILHHWEHGRIAWPWLRYLYLRAKLTLRRLLVFMHRRQPGEVPEWELSYRAELAYCRHYIRERSRPEPAVEDRGTMTMKSLPGA